jgi:hypothetical protein
MGVIYLYIIHNDIYLDIQSYNYGKDDELVGTPYLKFYKWWVLAVEFLDDKRYLVVDRLDKSVYIRIPRFSYKIFGTIFKRKYIKM